MAGFFLLFWKQFSTVAESAAAPTGFCVAGRGGESFETTNRKTDLCTPQRGGESFEVPVRNPGC